MASQQLNATRMELMKLKDKLVITRRGHKLMKDKQDEMIRQFLEIVDGYKALRQKVEAELVNATTVFALARARHNLPEINEKMMVPSGDINITSHKKNVLGILVPKLSITPFTPELTYSLIDSSPQLDQAILNISALLPSIIKLAEVDKTCRLLALEIQKARRRVNAIEHFMIPEIIDTIKEISTKLADVERASIIRVMKSKEIILAKNQGNKTAKKTEK